MLYSFWLRFHTTPRDSAGPSSTILFFFCPRAGHILLSIYTTKFYHFVNKSFNAVAFLRLVSIPTQDILPPRHYHLRIRNIPLGCISNRHLSSSYRIESSGNQSSNGAAAIIVAARNVLCISIISSSICSNWYRLNLRLCLERT